MPTPQQPVEDQAAMLARIQELFSGVTGGGPDFSGAFNQALSANADMQAPAALPVPGRVNPLGGMASIFAATLADQMGARGSTAAAQQNIDQANAASDAAAHENFARSEAFNTSKQLQRMGILMKLGEAKAEALAKGTDHAAYEAQVKANMMIAERAKTLQENVDARQAEQAHKYRMDEIMAAKTATGADKAAATQAKEDEQIRKFQEDISNIAKKPGSMTPAEKANWLMLSFKDKAAQLGPAGIAQIKQRSRATAIAATLPGVKKAAMDTYISLLPTDPNTGSIILKEGSKEATEFMALAHKVFPDEAAYTSWASAYTWSH